MTDRPMDIHDYVRELTDERTHHERLWDGTKHRVTFPPLLDQLASAIQPTRSIDSGRPGFQSNSAARIEAIDALIEITKQAGAWLKRLNAPDPHSDKLRIRRLGSLTAPLDQHTYTQLEKDIRTWWRWARILTGWDTPTFRPHNTCPHCDTRDSLRIRIDDMLATCVHCRATWDSATIGLLAEHIRTENHDTPAELGG